jgi:cephalosporin-C deacetylase-like acetyl esterase
MMPSCQKILGALLLLAAALPCGRGEAQAPPTIYSEDSVPPYTLPDPLVLASGTRVTTAEQWWQQRRPELLHLFENEVYGKAPGRPAAMTFKVRSVDRAALGGKATRKEVRVYFTGREDGPKMDILLYLPNQRTGPVATFLGLNFHGNHAVENDPGITLSDAWMLSNGAGVVNRHATEASRGTNAGPWQVDRILARGYGFATVYYGDLDPDFNDGFHNGIHPAFYRPGQTHPDPDQWASIGAWSWGLSRALDYLETDPDVDAKRVAVMGHSRLGKAALWAAAQDPRFAMAISNESGAGGAALSKRIYGETVERLNTSFPHWFAGNFRKYSNNEAALPVDQHELLALIAPRPLYVASAVGDQWSDPKGEFLGAKGADPVYRLLGTSGLSASEMPAVEHPVAGTIGYHIRAGKHDVTAYDWERYLDFADAHLRAAKPAPAAAPTAPKEDLRSFHHPSTGEFMAYIDAPNSLYHYLSGEAHRELAQRAAAVARLNTPAEWRARQESVRRKLQDAIGAFPARTPLNARVTGTVRKDGFRVEKLVYESRPGFHVTGALFVPESATAKPAPAILYLSGHAADAFRSAAYQHVILNLVRKGFVVLAIDPVGQGERIQYLEPGAKEPRVGVNTPQHSYVAAQFFLTGGTLAREMIWDGIRGIDYLTTRPEVDPNRIGVTGRSGGGTQSAYVAAFDPRVRAAAPENYITSFRRLWETHGPQDGEQHFYRTNASGLDQADLLLARAPRPTLMVTTTRDIFSIQGARESFREMKRAFQALGAPDALRMVEDDATHETTLKNREATYAFFQEALGLPGDPHDEEVEQLTTAELQVTSTGQVSTSLGGKSAFDLTRATATGQAEALKRARAAADSKPERAVEAARSLSGYREPGEPMEPLFMGRYQRPGYAVEKYVIPVEGGYPVPYLLMVPGTPGPHPAVIYLHPEGKQAEAARGGEMEWLVRQGYTVAAPDLVGVGEMGPGYFRGDSYDVGVGKAPYGLWFGAQDVGDSFVGLQAADVVRLLRTLRARPDVVATEIRVVARGAATPVAQYAAAFEPAVAGVALLEPLLSYADVATTEYYSPDFLSGAVAGMLTAYDLPDLSAAIAPRPLLVVNPVDAAGRAAAAADARAELAAAQARYAARGAPDRFGIVTASADGVRDALGRWLRGADQSGHPAGH